MTQETLDATLEHASRELRRRRARYRDARPAIDLAGRTAIVVDDGIATGMTELAAVRALRKRGAQQIIVAVPVGSSEAMAMLEAEADRVVCLTVPRRLYGVGMWYHDFAPVSDEQVLALLAQAPDSGADAKPAEPAHASAPESSALIGSEELTLDVDQARLRATLLMPKKAPRAAVLFAHGSGSSRLSPRNRAVADTLVQAGFAALLLDLLDEAEAQRRELFFDIPLLSKRLEAVTRQALSDGRLAAPVGYFGASTGAAAALRAAASLGETIKAVVSRGGRADLADDRLHAVRCPTLLIVGEHDTDVLARSRRAAQQLSGPHDLVVVPGAGHLFAEPGALEQVAALALGWFARHLS
jgi:dienelactone hydrolase